MSNTLAGSPAADAVPLRTWIGIVAAILGVFLSILDIQITNASMPEILGSLSASQEEGSWMSTAYLAAEVTVIPLTAYFIRLFGIRSYMIGNSVLFLLFSTLCGFAWNLPSMIVFRMLQGLAGGALVPAAMTLLLTRLPLSKRGAGLAWLMLSTTLAPTLGPTLGGWLTGLYGWPTIFFINWVPCVLMVAGLAYGLKHEPPNLKLLRQADWPSIAAMVLGLVSLIVFLEEGNPRDWFSSAFVRTAGAMALLGLGFWITRMLLQSQPYINLRLYGRRNFGFSSVVGAAAGMGLYGSTFILPLFLAQIAGYNSMQIGEVIMWMGLPQIFMMPVAAKLSKHFDNRLVCSVGLILFAISCFLNSGMDANTTLDQLIYSQVFRALGQPLIVLTLSNFATNRMELVNMPSASSLFNMSRILGGAVGTAILATVLTIREQYHSARIGEAVSVFASATQERLTQLTVAYLEQGSSPLQASQQASATIADIVRREAYVMAYNDSFFLLGTVLLGAIVALSMVDRVVPGGGK